MANVVGIAIESNVVRAAYRDGGSLVFVETMGDANTLERAIDVLRTAIGNTQSIVLSVGLGLLEIAQPELPPMSVADRRRVLLRDADRYFPIEGSLAIATSANNSPSYAISADQLHQWTRALEEWAPVSAVVAGPDATASVQSRTGDYLIDAGSDETGLLHIDSGRVTDARRIPKHASRTIPKGATSLLVDGTETAPGKYSAAVGALNFANGSLDMMLLDSSLENRLNSARLQRQWTSYAFAAAALVVLAFAASSRREATLRTTQHAVDSLSTLAAPALSAKARLVGLADEANILSKQSAANSDALHVLAVLSSALPKDAFVERLAWDGAEWQLNGSVNQSASVVPSLDSARIFLSVRVLGASNRFRDGARMRETFAVAFKVKGDSVVSR